MRQSKKNRFTRRSALILVLALLCAVLSASPASADATYVVVSGDTLSGIAEDHNISLQELLDANNLGINDIIYIGQELTIPGVEEYVTEYGDLVVEGRGWGHGRGMGQGARWEPRRERGATSRGGSRVVFVSGCLGL